MASDRRDAGGRGGLRHDGTKWAGPLAAVFVFVLGELDLSLGQAIPFNGTFRSNLWQSPSFLFGLALFTPTILILAPGAPNAVRRPRAGRWIVGTALAAACLGAKATILPVVVGGGMFAVGVAWLRQRRFMPDAARATVLAGGLLVLGSMTLYLGGQTGFIVAPLASITRTPAWRLMEESARFGAIGPLGNVVLGGVVLAALLTPIAGMLLLDRRRMSLGPRPWLAGLLLAALAAYLVFDHPGVSQLYFLHYGVVAGALLAAWAIVDVERRDPASWRAWHRPLAGAALVTALTTAAAALIAPDLARSPIAAFWAPYAVFVAAAVASAVLAAPRFPRARPRFVGAALVGMVLATSALDGPLDLGEPVARVLAGDQVVRQDGPERRGVTSDLLEGLHWIRDHTEPDAIVAVNSPYLRPGTDPRSFLVSAFAERRVFLEGWAYSAEGQVVAAERLQGRTVDEPFPDRRATNTAVFERADPTAARALRDAGVGYLFVDRWVPSPPLDRIGTLLFENSAVRIYRLATSG